MYTSPYAAETADLLVKAGAFLLRPAKPFKLTSGLWSPFYVNCRNVISHPQVRSRLAELTAAMIRDKIGLANVQYIAGGVTAGVPLATLVADRLQLPLVYVRPEPKGHGTGQQIEGGDVAGKKTVLVEDVLVMATSSKKFTDALRAANAQFSHMTLIFDRATAEGRETLQALGITTHALCMLPDLQMRVRETKVYSDSDIAEMDAFTQAPQAWSAAHTPASAA